MYNLYSNLDEYFVSDPLSFPRLRRRGKIERKKRKKGIEKKRLDLILGTDSTIQHRLVGDGVNSWQILRF